MMYGFGLDRFSCFSGLGGSMFRGGGIFMFIFLILIVIAIVLLFRDRSLGKRFRSGIEWKETPMDILKKRYANGEILEREYEEMKRKLKD